MTPGASSSRPIPTPAGERVPLSSIPAPRPANTPDPLPPVLTPTPTFYDTTRFVSREAAVYHFREVEKKALIKERGLRITHALEEPFRVICEARQWLEFIELPRRANIGMVREFYANLTDTPIGYEVRVRGHMVDFSPAAINALFHLPDLTAEADTLALEGDHSYTMEEVTAAIATPDAPWVMKRNGRYRHILTGHLTHEARVWFQFVISRLIPSSHVSDCTLDRALLLYSILTGRPIDLGRLISSMMRSTARTIQWGLWFLDIITRLCQQAGVLPALDDLYFRPGTMITGLPSPPAAPGSGPAPFLRPPGAAQVPPAQPDFTHQLWNNLAQIRTAQRLQAVHIDQWFRSLALNVPDWNPATFPPLPPIFGDPDDPGDMSPGDAPAPAPHDDLANDASDSDEE